MYRSIGIALLPITVLACSSANHPLPNIHNHSLEPGLCQVFYSYQISPDGKLQYIEVQKEVDCEGRTRIVELTDEFKSNVCASFRGTGVHSPTYMEGDEPAAVLGFALLKPDQVVDSQRTIPGESGASQFNASVAEDCMRLIGPSQKPNKTIEPTR